MRWKIPKPIALIWAILWGILAILYAFKILTPDTFTTVLMCIIITLGMIENFIDLE